MPNIISAVTGPNLLPLRLKTFFNFLLPFIIFGLCLFFAEELIPYLNEYHLVVRSIPYILFVFTALLSAYFSRHRLFYCAVLMGLFFALLTSIFPAIAESHQQGAFLSTGLLMPISISILAWVSERGVFSEQSFYMLLWLLLVGSFGTWLVLAPSEEIINWLTTVYFPLPSFLPAMFLPQSVLVSVLVSLILVYFRLCLIHSWTNNTFLAVIVVTAYVLVTSPPANFVALLFSVLGVMLFASILNESYAMAYRDELTGIMGRRALNEYMKRLGRRYSIAMLDIDHFKKFNDTHGHDVGDQVLKMVAARMTRVAGGGRVFRYGGEEFVIVFSRKSVEQVKVYLDDLRENIANYPMTLRSKSRPKIMEEGKKFRRKKTTKKQVSVTVSIGVAQKGAQQRLPEEVLKLADQALYKAKKAGRNKVVVNK